MNKRYIIEMCNDYIKKNPEIADKLNRLRNGYICGMITGHEVIKYIADNC